MKLRESVRQCCSLGVFRAAQAGGHHVFVTSVGKGNGAISAAWGRGCALQCARQGGGSKHRAGARTSARRAGGDAGVHARDRIGKVHGATPGVVVAKTGRLHPSTPTSQANALTEKARRSAAAGAVNMHDI